MSAWNVPPSTMQLMSIDGAKGDGGVCGLADSSELVCFTRQLLARRYSESDIQKIWGGNFLRVMSMVQNGKK